MKKILLGFIAIGLLTFVGCEKDDDTDTETTDSTETSSDEGSTDTSDEGTDTSSDEGSTDTSDEGTDTSSDEVKDADGYTYKTVTIGTQEWMVENLRTTKYSDGTVIPNVTDDTEWENDTTGAWCNYKNDNQYDTIYGKLYNFYAVETGKLCPTGWHVPTFYEWNALKTYLMEKGHREGTVLKSTLGWNDHIGKSGNGTDNYGWSGLPGGRRNYSGSFSAIGEIGYWWSSTAAIDLNMAEITSITNSRGGLNCHLDFNRLGASVRCLRD